MENQKFSWKKYLFSLFHKTYHFLSWENVFTWFLTFEKNNLKNQIKFFFFFNLWGKKSFSVCVKLRDKKKICIFRKYFLLQSEKGFGSTRLVICFLKFLSLLCLWLQDHLSTFFLKLSFTQFHTLHYFFFPPGNFTDGKKMRSPFFHQFFSHKHRRETIDQT